MLPFALFNVLKVRYAVSCEFVREMLVLPAIIAVPQQPSHFRGVISLRDRIIAVADVRKRLGVKTLAEDTEVMIQMLSQRRKDHEDWLTELMASTKENRPFTKATDPHKCAFGKWYDTFHSEILAVSSHLAKFDQPHQRIHAIAMKVEECKTRGAFAEAFAIIEQTRGTQLAEMIRLFDEAPRILHSSQREIVIVVEIDGKYFGLIVDEVTSTEVLEEHQPSSQDAEKYSTNPFVQRIAKRKGTEDLVLVVDPRQLIQDQAAAVA